MLASGGAVVFTFAPHRGDPVRLRFETLDPEAPEPSRPAGVEVPAVYVEVEDEVALARAVVSPEVATRLGEEPVESAVVVEGPIGVSRRGTSGRRSTR
jgi:hypothetical protein